MPTALITGVSGQDGSYLAQFLLAQGYRVIGTTRDARRALELPYAAAFAGVDLRQCELWDTRGGLADLIQRERPDEVYHLGAPSSVAASWSDPEGTEVEIALSTARLIECLVEELPSPRLFVAGSAEIFAPSDAALDEDSPRGPTSPYGRGKLTAMEFVASGRRQFGLYAVTGILFNHESPRRGDAFVSRKIARAAARISRGEAESVSLGSLDIRRDWGFAGDYVRAMWLMLFQDEPADFVVGTGVTHTIAELCEVAFSRVGLDWRDHVTSDPGLTRPADPPVRWANPARAKERLGWTPEVDFERLIWMLVDDELNRSGT
jgi:GDPmannose 4,6-dehydratase